MSKNKVTEAKSLADKDELFANGSRAVVKHEKNNIIKITVTDIVNNVWEGFAVMDSKDVGCLTFYYKKLRGYPEPWKRNGVRRLGILNGGSDGKKRISLFSEDSPPHGVQRFGREILTKD